MTLMTAQQIEAQILSEMIELADSLISRLEWAYSQVEKYAALALDTPVQDFKQDCIDIYLLWKAQVAYLEGQLDELFSI